MIPSLRAILLRNKKSAKPKFKQRVRSKYHKRKQRLIIFLSLLGVGGLVYWLQSADLSIFRSDAEGLSQSENIDPTNVLQYKQEDLSTSDLIFLASKMERDINAPLPVQMQWVRERLDVANKLLAMPDDDVAQKEGTLYRIEALQLYSNLNRKHQLGNDMIDTQLRDLCSANLSHGDPEVAKIAAAAMMMSSIHEFATEPTLANQKLALQRCNQVAFQLPDDEEIAAAIYKYARLMKRSDLMVDDSVEFFDIVIKRYLDSPNQKARNLAANAYNEIVFGDQSAETKFASLLVDGIKDRFRQNRKSVDRELTNRIRYSLRRELVNADAIEQIAALIDIFVAVDRIPDARILLDEVQSYFLEIGADHQELSAAANKHLVKLYSRIEHYNQPFDLDGLIPIGNEPVDFDSRLTLLCYWSDKDTRSVQMLSSLSTLSLNRILQCIVIVHEPDEQSLLVAEKLSKEIQGFKFVKADTESPSGREFDSRFPVPSVPYIVLLNDELRVVAINPEFRDLSKRVQAQLN